MLEKKSIKIKNRNNNKIEIIRKLITKNNRSYKRKHWNEEEN